MLIHYLKASATMIIIKLMFSVVFTDPKAVLFRCLLVLTRVNDNDNYE